MENEFVSYEQAVALKELGFNEPCLGFWNLYTKEFNYNPYPSNFTSEDVVQIPLKSQAFRWYREKYGVISYIKPECLHAVSYYDYVIVGYDMIKGYYEEAENACIDKLIEKSKQKER